MREIKFRAFVKNHSRIIYSDEFVNGDLSLFFSSVETMRRQGGDIVIEQFTGISDKNGKEIYEGDIVKKVSKIDGVHWYDFDYIKAVEISPQGVEPCGEYDSDCAEHEKGEFWEIIGNIHENPELLENVIE